MGGALDSNGYPRARYGNTSFYPHREAYLGELKPGDRVYRWCGERTCVNPYHVTTTEPEMQRRTRLRRKPNGAKLTRQQVTAIREQWAQEDRPTQRELAVRYGVSRSAISMIVRGKTWRNRGEGLPVGS